MSKDRDEDILSFAAQVGGQLKEVDQQFSGRPSDQNRAFKLDVNKIVVETRNSPQSFAARLQAPPTQHITQPPTRAPVEMVDPSLLPINPPPVIGATEQGQPLPRPAPQSVLQLVGVASEINMKLDKIIELLEKSITRKRRVKSSEPKETPMV